MTKHETHTEGDRTIIFAVCTDCGQHKLFSVLTAHYDAWINGQVIQAALPEVSVDDRELLISGTCGPCFDKLFADEDD